MIINCAAHHLQMPRRYALNSSGLRSMSPKKGWTVSRALNILIADDDASLIAPYVQTHLSSHCLVKISLAESPEATLQIGKAQSFDLILLDIDFGRSELSGLDLIDTLRRSNRLAKIVMLSSQDSDASLLKALKNGADDFLSKRTDKLNSVPKYVEALARELQVMETDLQESSRIASLVGAAFLSPVMREVFRKVVIARRNPQLPVLITGETGTGKEVIANAITIGTGRPKIAIDCGAISETIAESELFGHVRGAFTGAERNKVGKLAMAPGGEVFLDEIGNLKKSIQEKLLRVIQLKELTPVGGTSPVKIDARIIAATNENLEMMVSAGTFRSDLLERLKGVWIELPPLRDRLYDLDVLIDAILKRSARPDLEMAQTCIAVLKNYSWPGNIRELESVLAEMVANCAGSKLTISHLPHKLKQRIVDPNGGATTSSEHSKNSTVGFSPPDNGSWNSVVDELLRFYLPRRFQALGQRGSRRELAQSLDLSRNTLAGHLKRLDIQLGDEEIECSDHPYKLHQEGIQPYDKR